MKRLLVALVISSGQVSAQVTSSIRADGSFHPGDELFFLRSMTCADTLKIEAEVPSIGVDGENAAFSAFEATPDGRVWTAFIAYLEGVGDMADTLTPWAQMRMICQMSPQARINSVARAVFLVH